MQSIAIVTADPSLRDALRRRLGSLVAQFASFGDFAAAEDLLDHPPTLAVVDAVLPDGTGRQLVAELRRVCPRSRCRILLLTEGDDESAFMAGFAAGADQCLAAPVHVDQLAARCRHLLGRSRRDATRRVDVEGGAKRRPKTDRYEVVRPLGQGAYGTVFEATDKETGRRVALKVLDEQHSDVPEALLRTLRETYALSAARSRHLVGLVDFGRRGESPCFAMEFVEGPTLAEHVRERGPLSEAEVIGLVRGLACAVQALERADVVHRDIKPANVILRGGRCDDPVLVDFGLAKRPFDRAVTSQTVILGTPGYIAPEALTEAELDTRCDLYAVGMVARFALAGREIFTHLDGAEILQRVVERPVPLPQHASPRLRRILRGLVEARRERRIGSAGRVLELLEELSLAAPEPVPA